MRIDLPKFANKSDLYAFLVKRKEDIFQAKCNEVKKSDVSFNVPYDKLAPVIKVASTNEDTDTEIKRTIIGNTYYWMDSHEDVHLSKCFDVSIKQRGFKKIRHYHDHLNQLTAEVGKFQKIYEQPIAWKLLGIDKEGETESLFADSNIKKAYNEKIFTMYKDGDIDQHSVGLQYVQLGMAINDPEYPKEYAEWNAVYPLLGNPEEADKKGYFFTVKEAKLFEISCVPEGSNSLTPTLELDKDIDPSDDSQLKTDPVDPVDKTQVIHFDLI